MFVPHYHLQLPWQYDTCIPAFLAFTITTSTRIRTSRFITLFTLLLLKAAADFFAVLRNMIPKFPGL